MTMTKVESSNIHSIGYDGAKGELVVQFRNGRRYKYEGVTSGTYGEFVAAESQGRHFAKHIRGQYKTTRLEEAGEKRDG